MFRDGSGNSNRPDGRVTSSGRFSGILEDFCTLLCFYHNSLIEYRIDTKLVLLESLEKSYNLNV